MPRRTRLGVETLALSLLTAGAVFLLLQSSRENQSDPTSASQFNLGGLAAILLGILMLFGVNISQHISNSPNATLPEELADRDQGARARDASMTLVAGTAALSGSLLYDTFALHGRAPLLVSATSLAFPVGSIMFLAANELRRRGTGGMAVAALFLTGAVLFEGGALIFTGVNADAAAHGAIDPTAAMYNLIGSSTFAVGAGIFIVVSARDIHEERHGRSDYLALQN